MRDRRPPIPPRSVDCSMPARRPRAASPGHRPPPPLTTAPHAARGFAPWSRTSAPSWPDRRRATPRGSMIGSVVWSRRSSRPPCSRDQPSPRGAAHAPTTSPRDRSGWRSISRTSASGTSARRKISVRSFVLARRALTRSRKSGGRLARSPGAWRWERHQPSRGCRAAWSSPTGGSPSEDGAISSRRWCSRTSVAIRSSTRRASEARARSRLESRGCSASPRLRQAGSTPSMIRAPATTSRSPPQTPSRALTGIAPPHRTSTP